MLSRGYEVLACDISPAMVERACRRSRLQPAAVLVADNSLAVYRDFFSRDTVLETDEAVFCWRGIEIFSTGDGECWTRASSRHVQRHHGPTLVRRLLAEAGIELLELYGQGTGARLEQPADEKAHQKLVYFCRRSAARGDLIEGR